MSEEETVKVSEIEKLVQSGVSASQLNNCLQYVSVLDVMKLLKDPKPTFQAGELIELIDSNGRFICLDYFDSKQDNQSYKFKSGNYWNTIRKLDSTPLVPIAHNSRDKPEGLDADGVILVHYKGYGKTEFQPYRVCCIVWDRVDYYCKVHFLPGVDDE